MIAVLTAFGPVWAHEGLGATGGESLRWMISLEVLAGLVLIAALYASGLRRLWQHAGIGQGVRQSQAVSFLCGIAALGTALSSPLETLSAALFSAHMLQHIVLILLVPPLLISGVPGYVLWWVLPLPARKRVARMWRRPSLMRRTWQLALHPIPAWLLHITVLWIWHLPALYEAAVQHEAIHALEHAMFLVTAGLFWWVLLHPLGRRRMNHGVGALYLFVTSLQGSALGVLISLAPRPWYAVYADRTVPWGLSPLQDQQLAGLIMWMPVGSIYALMAAILLGLWLRTASERDGTTMLGTAQAVQLGGTPEGGP
jgi:putative membrane protein